MIVILIAIVIVIVIVAAALPMRTPGQEKLWVYALGSVHDPRFARPMRSQGFVQPRLESEPVSDD
jgi:hypothetical protein